MKNSQRKKFFHRFFATNTTIMIDRVMAIFIKIVSLSTILAILTIFFFIAWEVIPLFQKAKLKPLQRLKLLEKNAPLETSLVKNDSIAFIGSDEWGELPFTCNQQGIFNFYFTGQEAQEVITIKIEDVLGKLSIDKAAYRQDSKVFAMATTEGYVILGEVIYAVEFSDQNKRILTPQVTMLTPLPVWKGKVNQTILQMAYANSDDKKVVASIVKDKNSRLKNKLMVFIFVESVNFFGESEGLKLEKIMDFNAQIEGESEKILLSKDAQQLIVVTDKGLVHYFDLEAEELIQKFRPFPEKKFHKITEAQYLFGDMSVMFVSEEGAQVIFSMHANKESNNKQLYAHTKTFPSFHTGKIDFYAGNVRNKAFAMGYDNFFSLRYLTTADILLEKKMPFYIDKVIFNDKYNRLIFLEKNENYLSIYTLKDPHAGANWKTFFAPIQYESSDRKNYTWQSSAANQDYEPKFSMMPLIWGSLKGTFFALIFALPLALSSAFYTSQFLNKKIKNIIKPTIEIMNAIPSVVLGFLGALYIAPFIEKRIPSVLLIILMIPLSAFMIGKFWHAHAITSRFRSRWLDKLDKGKGWEFIIYSPVMLLVIIICWQMGPLLEKILFIVIDPETGREIADFRLWWTNVTHANYEQRNAIIAGFAMGFTVIPIIFSIAEEAFSNVPKDVRSGGLALGATEWQIAMHIVLPAALGGIFSAVMIGFGRAIGETMIVLMATGNTPLIDLNPFTGMRTLSANIAVELPEAPKNSTLYRALFLGAFILFIFTFTVNTLAEIIRQKFKKEL